MKVIPLGTNGFFPTFNRQTACFAIPFGKTLIILDAGSGLFRLAEPSGRKLLRNIKNVHLYLSHYHLDHTFGFYAAFRLLEGKKVTVFAESGRQVFWEFVTLKHFPINYAKVHKNFTWETIGKGTHKISSYKISIRKQLHRGEGSLAFRFEFMPEDKELAYVTDSEPTYESAEFVAGVDLLLHEHGQSGEEKLKKRNVELEEHFDDGHVTTVGAATIAKEAKVGKLALIHHFPFYDEKRLQQQLKLARSIFAKTILAQDLKQVEF